MRFVFDTNAIVSALLTPRGTRAEVLRAVLQRHRLIVSLEMVTEYTDVILRPDFDRIGPPKLRLERLREILSVPGCLAIRPLTRHSVVAEDPSDNLFADAAVWAGADYLVSGDAHLCALTQIRSPHLKRPVSIVGTDARELAQVLPALYPQRPARSTQA